MCSFERRTSHICVYHIFPSKFWIIFFGWEYAYMCKCAHVRMYTRCSWWKQRFALHLCARVLRDTYGAQFAYSEHKSRRLLSWVVWLNRFCTLARDSCSLWLAWTVHQKATKTKLSYFLLMCMFTCAHSHTRTRTHIFAHVLQTCTRACRLKKAEAERVMDAEKAAKREKKEIKWVLAHTCICESGWFEEGDPFMDVLPWCFVL